jgi:hypothetical protein
MLSAAAMSKLRYFVESPVPSEDGDHAPVEAGTHYVQWEAYPVHNVDSAGGFA